MTRSRIAILVLCLASLLVGIAALLRVEAPVDRRYGASGFFAAPTGPAGGALIGTYPNPGLDAAALAPTYAGDLLGSTASTQWVASIAGSQGEGGAVTLNGTHLVAQGTGVTPSGIYIDLTAEDAGKGYGSFHTVYTPVVDTTSAAALSLGSTNASAINVGDGGTATTFYGPVNVTPLTTSATPGATTQISGQGSSASTGSGGPVIITGGTATGVTAGTPGGIFLQRLAPTGAGSEVPIIFERGNTVDARFSSLTSSNLGVAWWFGSGNVGSFSTSNYSIYVPHAGGNLQINDATEILLTLSGSIYETITTSTTTLSNSNIVLGNSGSGGTLTFNGPALTTSQSTGTAGLSGLSALQVYSFLPVTINGVAVQLVVTH